MAKRRSENTVTIVGKIIHKGELKKVGKKETLMLEMWVEENDEDLKYPNAFSINFFKGTAYDVEDSFNEGDEVRIRATVGGRVFEREKDGEKFLFNKVTGWSCKPADAPESSPSESSGSQQNDVTDDDDLPF